jgi:hypothetical protein
MIDALKLKYSELQVRDNTTDLDTTAIATTTTTPPLDVHSARESDEECITHSTETVVAELTAQHDALKAQIAQLCQVSTQSSFMQWC